MKAANTDGGLCCGCLSVFGLVLPATAEGMKPSSLQTELIEDGHQFSSEVVFGEWSAVLGLENPSGFPST